MIELTPWHIELCTVVSRQKLTEYANGLRGYYDALPRWKWIARLRARHQLRIVTVVQDSYQMGWQDGSKGKTW